MNQNTGKENENSNTNKRDLGKISYSPFHLLDQKVEFSVKEDMTSLIKADLAQTNTNRKNHARKLMGRAKFDDLMLKNQDLADSHQNRFDPNISDKIEQQMVSLASTPRPKLSLKRSNSFGKNAGRYISRNNFKVKKRSHKKINII